MWSWKYICYCVAIYKNITLCIEEIHFKQKKHLILYNLNFDYYFCTLPNGNSHAHTIQRLTDYLLVVPYYFMY